MGDNGKRCETPGEHYLSARPSTCSTPDCDRSAAFWTRPDGDCPSCKHPRAIPAEHSNGSWSGEPHRAWCVLCRDRAVTFSHIRGIAPSKVEPEAVAR